MVKAVRDVQLYHHGAGDYARDRDEWLGQMSHDQIANLMVRGPEEEPGQAGSSQQRAARQPFNELVMPTTGEHETVQASILAYNQAILRQLETVGVYLSDVNPGDIRIE